MDARREQVLGLIAELKALAINPEQQRLTDEITTCMMSIALPIQCGDRPDIRWAGNKLVVR